MGLGCFSFAKNESWWQAEDDRLAMCHRCDLLSLANRLSMAPAAERFSALGHGLVVFPALASRWCMDAGPPGSLCYRPAEGRSSTLSQRHDHGQPIGEDNGKGGVRGFDGHKKVKGRKRQLLVDTLGFPLACRVEPANMSDKKAARYLVSGLSQLWPRIETVIADAGYLSEKLTEFIKAHAGWTLTIVKWSEPEFTIVGLNWIVERTFAWLGRERRLSKDYEQKVQTSETLIQIAACGLFLKRIAN